MHITVLAVGKIKERFFQQAIDEYMKRLSRYHKVDIIEVEDEKAPESMSEAEEMIVKDREGKRILKNLREDAYVITLEIGGKELSSPSFAEKISKLCVGGVSHVAFIIGGSLGLSEEVCKASDMKLSFGPMTYPHQLMRVILLEQIYRASRINAGEPYHK